MDTTNLQDAGGIPDGRGERKSDEIADATGNARSVPDSESTRAELERLLSTNESQLGEAYCAMRDQPDISLAEIVERTTIANPAAASNLRAFVRAVLREQLPSSPSIAQQAAGRVSSLLRQPDLTVATRDYLATLKAELEGIATDESRRQEEEQQLRDKTELALVQEEIVAEPCVYVYSMPHYIRYAATGAGTDDERRWLKIGRTTRDPGQRLREQMGQTALPEDPVLLRVYRPQRGEDVADIEARFHNILKGFAQQRAVGRSTGREWFLTSVSGLDAVAQALGLRTDVSTNPTEEG